MLNFFKQPKKTLDDLLSDALTTINNLRTVAEEQRVEALTKTTQIEELQEIVRKEINVLTSEKEKASRTAAHAEIVAKRMEDFINVSEKDIDLVLDSTV